MQMQIDSEDRNWAIYANAAGLLAFTNIPFANLIGPLLIWLKVRNDPAMPFARAHARSALNFQITWTLALAIFIATTIATIVGSGGMPGLFLPGHSLIVPFVTVIALVVANAVICILGCVRASNADMPANPFVIPFVR